jgi:diadenylate cyclase
MFDRIQQLFSRIGAYPWWQVALELLVIAVVVYIVFRFLQGTRAAGALKGLLVVLVIATLLTRVIGQREAFQRLSFLYDNFLTIAAIALIVIFQPELRRGLTRLGEAPLFRRPARAAENVVDEIVTAAKFLAKARFGAIIVIERDIPLKGMVEGGTRINGDVTAQLLQTIFFPGSALHDLAVTVHGEQVVAAGVQLPMAEPGQMPDPSLGARHRAAVGVSNEGDAIVVVVSEEKGLISVAERGTLIRDVTPEQLTEILRSRLVVPERGKSKRGRKHGAAAPVAEQAPKEASVRQAAPDRPVRQAQA